MKTIIRCVPIFIGKFFSYIYPYKIHIAISKLKINLYSGWISSGFSYFGKNVKINPPITLVGGRYISIGVNSYIQKRCVYCWENK